MIYFDRLFALKEKYKAALDEDASKRAKIEKDFADGWTTDACRKYELERQAEALEYCRGTTLEAAEAVKAEAMALRGFLHFDVLRGFAPSYLRGLMWLQFLM